MPYQINEDMTIVVKHKEWTFEFRLPTLFDQGKLGMRAKNLRLQTFPDSDGSEAGLDLDTIYLFRALAVVDVALSKTDAPWIPRKEDDLQKKVVFDSTKIESRYFNDLMEVYSGYLDAQDSFRSGGV